MGGGGGGEWEGGAGACAPPFLNQNFTFLNEKPQLKSANLKHSH